MSDTGPSKATRDQVHNRAEGCCELCGLLAVAGQIHHRLPRGMGGSSDPEVNSPANLALFCWDCHRFIESSVRRHAYTYGWLVPRGQDPARWPFLLLGSWVYFTEGGTYAPASVPETTEGLP